MAEHKPTKVISPPGTAEHYWGREVLTGVDSVERQGDWGFFRMGKPAKGMFLISLRQQDAWSEAEKQGLRAARLYKTRGTESISSLPFSHLPCSTLTKGETRMCDCHVYHWCNLLFGDFYSVSSLMGRGSKPVSAQEAAQSLLPTWQFILTSLHLFGPDALLRFTRLLFLTIIKRHYACLGQSPLWAHFP